MAFKYNPVNGLRDAVTFPSKPPGGTGAGSARDQVQDMLDQARDNMNDYLNYVTDTGAANAYVVTLDPVPVTYPLMLQMKAANANTGACTINPNGLGAKAIKKNVSEDLEAGAIKAGGVYYLVYDGTNYQLITRYNLEELVNNSTANIRGFYSDLAAWYGNTKLCAMFQPEETWTSGIGTQSPDSASVKLGNQSLKILENDNTAGQLYSVRNNISLDLTKFYNGELSNDSDYIYIVLFVSDAAAIGAGGVAIFFCSAPTYDGINTKVISLTGLSTGWNYLKILKSTFGTTGTGSWSNIQSMAVSWYTLANRQNAYVSFQLVQLLKKDPQAAYPNAFQRNGLRDLAVNGGEWFVGLENGEIICRNLKETTDIPKITGVIGYSNFTANLIAKTKSASFLGGVGWFVDSTNYIFSYINGTDLVLRKYEAGVSNLVSRPLAIADGDEIRFSLKKSGNNVTLIVIKNNNLNNPFILSFTTTLNGIGYLIADTINTIDKYANIKALSITTTEHASRADMAETVNSVWSSWVPTLTWTGTAPAVNIIVKARYTIIGNVCYFNVYHAADDGNGATGLTITLPVPPKDNDSFVCLNGRQKVGTTWSSKICFIDDSTNTIQFNNFAACTDAQAMAINVSGFYEIA
jgi:hypothetical protein